MGVGAALTQTAQAKETATVSGIESSRAAAITNAEVSGAMSGA